MDLAGTAYDASRLVDQDRGIEAAAVSGQFGKAEVEADAEFAGEIEQRLCLRARHAGLEEARDRLVVFHPVAREEGGEREFGKNHQPRTTAVRLAQQRDQAFDDSGAGIGEMDRAELGDGEAEWTLQAAHAGFSIPIRVRRIFRAAAADRPVGLASISEGPRRSEEHTSELQSLMRISYAVFCLKKKTHILHNQRN